MIIQVRAHQPENLLRNKFLLLGQLGVQVVVRRYNDVARVLLKHEVTLDLVKIRSFIFVFWARLIKRIVNNFILVVPLQHLLNVLQSQDSTCLANGARWR